jgi:uncharacterized protein YndB with AHSA1/START domain
MSYSKSIHIETPLNKVWEAWTSAEHASQWLAPRANIEFRCGGAFEFFWGDNPEQDSTLGCKLLEIELEKHLRFEWQGQTEFLHMFLPPTGRRAIIDVQFEKQDSGTTVSLMQAETRDDQQWPAYDAWMSKNWEIALESLKKYCEEVIDSTSA